MEGTFAVANLGLVTRICHESGTQRELSSLQLVRSFTVSKNVTLKVSSTKNPDNNLYHTRRA